MRYSKRSKGRAGRTVVLGGDDMVDGLGMTMVKIKFNSNPAKDHHRNTQAPRPTNYSPRYGLCVYY
jgi:hypothetical protein